MPEFLLAAGDSATVVESVGPEVYGKIFGGGVGLFVVGVGGAAITALLIDSTDAYERLAEDFGAEGMKGLEEEFGADAARAVVEGVKSDTADRKIDVAAPAPKEEPLFELPSLPSLPNPSAAATRPPQAAPGRSRTTTRRLRARDAIHNAAGRIPTRPSAPPVRPQRDVGTPGKGRPVRKQRQVDAVEARVRRGYDGLVQARRT